jgi:hypothetical protein
MNFYLSAVNNLVHHPDDRPSIGLILCKRKHRERLFVLAVKSTVRGKSEIAAERLSGGDFTVPKFPVPGGETRLLKAVNIRLPEVLPHTERVVVPREKLPEQCRPR